MSAIDELCHMLDERGARYIRQEREGKGTLAGVSWEYPAGDDSTDVFVATVVRYGDHLRFRGYLTPEQAIAATLGRDTCHLEEIKKDCDTASEYMLDREWCFDAVYRCSCGCRFGHVANNRPRFCPNCGRKVVDE